MGWLRTRSWARATAVWLAAAAAIGMLIVLVMGATVTNTGSAQGCGRQWPLCQGKFIPDFAVSTFIEFSHRAVTGVEGILIVAVAVLVVALWWDRWPVRILAPLMLGSLVLQAGMGAAAVMWPQSPLVLALHFGISLIALASAVLVAVYLRRIDRPLPAPVAGSVRWTTWAVAGYLYVLVYSGAYVRHTAAAAACPSWPGCAGANYHSAAALAVDIAHRVLAVIALALALGLVALYRRAAPGRPDLGRGAWLLVTALLAQGAAGAYLALSGFSLFSELTHDAVAGLAFVAAAYLLLLVTLDERVESALQLDAEPTPAASAAKPSPAR
jgi:cytochrome c oxidase assembly protein subunit 15